MIQHGRGHDFIEKHVFLRFLLFHCCVVALMSWSIFDRFWEPLGLKNRSKIDQTSIQKSIKKMIHFLIDFGATLAPFWRGFGSQVGAKLAQKSIQASIKKTSNKLSKFESILRGNLASKSLQNVSQEGAPFSARMDFWRICWLLGPRWPLDPSKRPPRSILDGFWPILYDFLFRFWMFFAGFGEYFLLFLDTKPIKLSMNQPINQSTNQPSST